MKGVLREFRTLAPFLGVVLCGAALLSFTEEAPASGSEPGHGPPSAVEASPSPGASPAAGGHAEAGAAQGPAARTESSACLVDASNVEDLKKRREELEQRQKALVAREAEFAAKERALKEELKRLENVRDEIAKGGASRKKEAEEKIAKLVETLENMSPKSGAQLLAGIDETLAVSAMSRLSTLKLAKVLSSMEPVRSARLTELLGGVKTRSGEASEDRMNLSAKGGERKDGRNNNDTRNAVAAVSKPDDGGKAPNGASADPGRQPAAVSGTAGSADGAGKLR